MNVFHTASLARGQIYMPLVNWLLAIGAIGAVLVFRSSDALGSAYGIAVSLLMAITTVLAALVALKWKYNPVAVAAVNGFFLVIDVVFVAANTTKLFEGGWFPLGLAFAIAFLMMTWRRGATLVEEARAKLRQPEDDFLAALLAAPPLRLPGTAAIFTAATSGVPLALTHQMKHTHVLHERVLLISGLVTQKPFQDPADHFKVVDVGHGIYRLIVQFGFMELPNMEEALRDACLQQRFPEIDLSKLTYYFRRETVLAGDNMDGMSAWRKRLFSAMHLNSHRHAAYYGVPAAQVVEIGLEVEI
jgi:KUP system potassium uptake protein